MNRTATEVEPSLLVAVVTSGMTGEQIRPSSLVCETLGVVTFYQLKYNVVPSLRAVR